MTYVVMLTAFSLVPEISLEHWASPRASRVASRQMQWLPFRLPLNGSYHADPG